MGYRIDIDLANCLTCGICMDVCPVQALDMRRPSRPGIEGEAANPWLMETPVQVGECVGCTICARECPVHVITVATADGPTPLAERQGPIAPPPPSDGWIPLSALTRESLREHHPSPFAAFTSWRTRDTANRDRLTWVTKETGETTSAAPAPCQVACPAGTDAARYIALIGEGRYDEAYAVAAEVNPFPSVCGWICTAPCEAACRRGVLDQPIAIRTLKRFAAEHGQLPPIAAPTTKRTERVAIVGGGPAGMSAAYYLARLGYTVTVFEAMPVPGGMMAIGIPEYRLPREALRAEIERIVELGVDLRLDSAMGRDFTLLDLERQGFDAIFLATGASRSRRLGVPGDDLEGVVPATLFLKRVNLGEAPRLGGDVAVVGGGSTAMDAARTALRSGATSVTILYRRGRSDMPAQREEVEAAEREGIQLRTATSVEEVVGHDGRVVGLRLVDRRPTANGGSATWETVAGSDTSLPVTTVLVAIGEEPDPSILPEGAGIGVSASAGIVADPSSLATSRAGVFAGGDVVSGARTVIDAVAAGRRVAGSIHAFLSGVADAESAIIAATSVPRDPDPAHLVLDIATRPREHGPIAPYVAGSFAPTEGGLGRDAARREALRCFRCDALEVCGSVTVLAGRGPSETRVAGIVAATAIATTTPNPPPRPPVGWLTTAPDHATQAPGAGGTK
jgi:NADPH-dependent glutamate synthase beta subunit-like oxidoreductase/Pyruvate/2-oxoacid:ferredoxin oxidoreductase delta subunit